MNQNRRDFFRMSGLAAVGAGFGLTQMDSGFAAEKSKSGKVLFDLGVASYSFRKFDNDQNIKWMQKAGIKYISLKDMHLAMKSTDDECAKLAKKYADAGLNIYACGVIYMRKKEDVENAFRYAKALGCRQIVGVPAWDLLPLVNEKVKSTGIKVGIHNHGPGDRQYPTARSVYERVKELDPGVGITLDIGHSIRIGEDPAAAIREFAPRILDFHFKDMNAANPKGSGVICGQGVIDLPEVVRALIDIKYAGVAAFEYEIDDKDPFPGFMQSLGYIRGICTMC